MTERNRTPAVRNSGYANDFALDFLDEIFASTRKYKPGHVHRPIGGVLVLAAFEQFPKSAANVTNS